MLLFDWYHRMSTNCKLNLHWVEQMRFTWRNCRPSSSSFPLTPHKQKLMNAILWDGTNNFAYIVWTIYPYQYKSFTILNHKTCIGVLWNAFGVHKQGGRWLNLDQSGELRAVVFKYERYCQRNSCATYPKGRKSMRKSRLTYVLKGRCCW